MWWHSCHWVGVVRVWSTCFRVLNLLWSSCIRWPHSNLIEDACRIQEHAVPQEQQSCGFLLWQKSSGHSASCSDYFQVQIMSGGMVSVAEAAYLFPAWFSFLKYEVHVVRQKKASAIERTAWQLKGFRYINRRRIQVEKLVLDLHHFPQLFFKLNPPEYPLTNRQSSPHSLRHRLEHEENTAYRQQIGIKHCFGAN